jgi:hypothetical protein
MTQNADTGGHPDRPVDGDHALLVGVLVGAVMSASEYGFRYEPRVLDDEDGNHLAVFEVRAPSGLYRVRVEKVPPNDRSEP